jgi:hypothetical protein
MDRSKDHHRKSELFYDPVENSICSRSILFILQKIGGDIPIGGVILLPMILGGKSPIFEERAHRGIIPGGAMVTGGV